jgi:mRNA-degrading endonuclease RelE of RelBE toxin-antitoxin system
MQPNKVEFPQTVAQIVKHLPPSLKRDVRNALRRIAGEPSAGKALRDDLEGLQSYRLGRFRIIYRTCGRKIEVVAIGPRRTIYRAAARGIRRESR